MVETMKPQETQDPVSIFQQFVDDCGGAQAAAQILGRDDSLIYNILNPNAPHKISRDMALRVEKASGGKYCKTALLFGIES